MRYQSLLNGIQDMIFVMRVSEDQRYFYYQFINTSAMKMTGYTAAIIGKEIAEVNPDHITTILHEKYREVVSGRVPITYQDSFHAHHSGHTVSETTLTPIFVGETVTQIVGLTRDITTLKQAEWEKDKSQQKLQFSRQRYKSLFDQNPDPILYLDLKGRIKRGNQAFERLFVTRIDVIKKVSFLALIKSNDEETIKRHFYQATLLSSDRRKINLFRNKTYNKA